MLPLFEQDEQAIAQMQELVATGDVFGAEKLFLSSLPTEAKSARAAIIGSRHRLRVNFTRVLNDRLNEHFIAGQRLQASRFLTSPLLVRFVASPLIIKILCGMAQDPNQQPIEELASPDIAAQDRLNDWTPENLPERFAEIGDAISESGVPVLKKIFFTGFNRLPDDLQRKIAEVGLTDAHPGFKDMCLELAQEFHQALYYSSGASLTDQSWPPSADGFCRSIEPLTTCDRPTKMRSRPGNCTVYSFRTSNNNGPRCA